MRYTKSNKALSDEQRRFYEENGFILIKNNVQSELIDELYENFKDYVEGRKTNQFPFNIIKNSSLKKLGVKGEKVVDKIQDFLYDDTFFKYASLGSITDVVESVIGPNIVAVHSMLINKPPSSDPEHSRHPLHQDLAYFAFRPIDSIVASWTAMEHVDKNNGCLYVLPGSHDKEIFYSHSNMKEKRNFYYEIPGFENHDFTDLVMEKGDTVFFHPLLLHGSYPNRTKGYRKAISVHFADSNCYFIDPKGTPSDILFRELEPLEVDAIDFFKMKSRHVKGKLGKFRNLTSNL